MKPINAKTVLLILALALISGFSLSAATSEDDTRLKNALARYPEADANNDGVLTQAEARVFLKKQRDQRGETKGPPAIAPKGGERHIYKKVGEAELPLYVFKPAGHEGDAGEAKAPAIVFFHGGSWRGGNPSKFEHQCKHLASRGMVAITVEYRVSSRHEVKVEDCIEDAKSAMRWVRGNAQKLGIDPNRIASSGGSAGGHLAACTAVIDDFNAATDNLKVSAKPNAMVLFNPVMKFNTEEADSRFAHGPIDKLDPYTYASKKQVPCIMLFGTDDRLLDGAKQYQKLSEKEGNQCKIVTYEGERHGFFNYEASGNPHYDLTLKEMDSFLVKLGWILEK